MKRRSADPLGRFFEFQVMDINHVLRDGFDIAQNARARLEFRKGFPDNLLMCVKREFLRG
jgi:hypothetical protein